MISQSHYYYYYYYYYYYTICISIHICVCVYISSIKPFYYNAGWQQKCLKHRTRSSSAITMPIKRHSSAYAIAASRMRSHVLTCTCPESARHVCTGQFLRFAGGRGFMVQVRRHSLNPEPNTRQAQKSAPKGWGMGGNCS